MTLGIAPVRGGKAWRYVPAFRYSRTMCRTDGQTDGRADGWMEIVQED